MRTETMTRTVYTYEELTAVAQAKARDWYREGMDYPWTRENTGSLQTFSQIFPVRAKEWSFDAMSAFIVPVFTGDDALATLRGPRLIAWLRNHHDQPGIPLPVFSRRRCFRHRGRKRLSRILVEETCCPMTGCYLDEVLLGPLRQFLTSPDHRCLKELLSDCLWAWVTACRDDWAGMLEDNAVAEAIIANGWEFTGSGIWADARFRWQAMA